MLTMAGAFCAFILAATGAGESPRRAGVVTVTVTEGTTTVEFYFNPKEYTIDKPVPWDEDKGSDSDAPLPEFSGVQGATFAFEVEYDRLADKGDVYLRDIRPLERLTLPDPQLKRPPMVLVSWGASQSFKGVVESVNVRYTLFLDDGTPTRATVRLRVREASRALGRGECRTSAGCPENYTCRDDDGDGIGVCVRTAN